MLHDVFDDADKYPYEEGRFFFGKSASGKAVGIDTRRHLLTFAGTQAGKGATLIVPNLRRWEHNVWGFDPKGENIALCWKQREAMGQRVAALDPYHVAKIPERLRATFNPLADLDADDPFTPSMIESLAEGLIIRHKADDAVWDNGGRTVVAGFIAFCVLAAEAPEKHLPAVAAQMRKADRDPTIYELMADIEHPLLGGLIREAASIGMSAAAENRQSQSYVRSALDQTKWLVTDSALADWLKTSSVSLTDLKEGNLSFFVCLPFDKAAVRPELLKMLLQYSMSVMQRDLPADKPSSRCLFVIDEAYCLGRVPDIQRNLAGLTSYGVQIWTIWQNIGQLHELYKIEGAAQFFSATDAVMFFGLGEFDDASPRIVAEAIGRIEVRDINVTLPQKRMTDAPPDVWARAYTNPVPPLPPQPTPQLSNDKNGTSLAAFGDMMSQSAYQSAHFAYQMEVAEQGAAQLYLALARERAEINLHQETTSYNHGMSMRGDYKVPPREVRKLTAKRSATEPARNMIVFLGSGDVIVPQLLPHWEPQVRHPYALQLEAARKAALDTNAKHFKNHNRGLREIDETLTAIDTHYARFGEDYRKNLPEWTVAFFEVLLGGLGYGFPGSWLVKAWQLGPAQTSGHVMAFAIAAIVIWKGTGPVAMRMGSAIGEFIASFIVRKRELARGSLEFGLMLTQSGVECSDKGIGETYERYHQLDAEYQPVKDMTI